MQIGKPIIVRCYVLMLFHLTRLELLWCLNGDWEAVLKEMVVTVFGDCSLEFCCCSGISKIIDDG
jgi:hypothetical protein